MARECRVAETHPCLPGHFPGNPLVPGVVQLDLVIQTLRAWRPDWRVIEFPTSKFLLPLLPGERFVIELEQVDADRIDFRCRDNDRLLSSGSLTVRPRSQRS